MIKPRIRNPELTRGILLHSAFEEIWAKGYAGASIDDIIAASDVTKGALYHHFPSKKALGLAVLVEVIQETISSVWVDPLAGSDDPVSALIDILEGLGPDMSEEELECGCPLNNFSQEMAGTDEDFQAAVQGIYLMWQEGVSEALQRGQKAGTVAKDVDPAETASFIVATCEGVAGLAKATRSRDILLDATKTMTRFLNSLRPVT